MNLIFLGPPGAGKGTVAARVSAEYHIPHISTGDLFRSAIKDGTELGLKVKSITESGDLVPDELTIALVRERLEEDDTDDGFIIDGFPRTIPQAEAYGTFVNVTKVLNFTLPDAEIVARLSGRRVCRNCGRTYHVVTMKTKKEGICDACGGELYTRKDDTVDSIKNRLEVYAKQTLPLVDYYEKLKLLVDVDSAPAPEAVFKAVTDVLGRRA